jgi:DNA-binding NarL/FixJ family response regulator
MKTQNITPPQKTGVNRFSLRISIIDDDPIASAVMKTRLANHFPNSSIETSKEPVITPNHDIYFVDNDFDGTSLATVLLRQIRELNPNALVVAMSSTLDQTELEALINGGCNAVYNKNRPAQSKEVFEVIENYIQVVQKQLQSTNGKPIRGIIHSLQDLMEQWNRRLANDIH